MAYCRAAAELVWTDKSNLIWDEIVKCQASIKCRASDFEHKTAPRHFLQSGVSLWDTFSDTNVNAYACKPTLPLPSSLGTSWTKVRPWPVTHCPGTGMFHSDSVSNLRFVSVCPELTCLLVCVDANADWCFRNCSFMSIKRQEAWLPRPARRFWNLLTVAEGSVHFCQGSSRTFGSDSSLLCINGQLHCRNHSHWIVVGWFV